MDDLDRLVHSEAYVITQSDYGEADRLYTLFTQKRGKIKAFAHGVRKAKSRKAGHLQSLSLIHLMLAKGKTFWIITQADTVDAAISIKNDLKKTASALYIFELLNRFATEDEPSNALFNLVKDTLARITEDADPFLSMRFYEFRLLKITGYMPNLTTCVQCSKEILPQDQYFSAEKGGVLCPQCGLSAYGCKKVSLPALKYLRFIQRSSTEELSKANIPELVRDEIQQLMQYYLTYISEKKLNTPLFIKQVGATAQNREIE